MNEVMLINGSVFIHPGDTDIYICIFNLKLGDILTNDIFISLFFFFIYLMYLFKIINNNINQVKYMYIHFNMVNHVHTSNSFFTQKLSLPGISLFNT